MRNIIQPILSISDKPILFFDEQGKLFIKDIQNVDWLLGEVDIDNNERKDNILKMLSPMQLKKIFTEDITLTYSERFVQVIMSEVTHQQENDWTMECFVGQNNRLDHALIKGDEIIGINECKHLSLTGDVSKDNENYDKEFKETFRKQLFNYFILAVEQNEKVDKLLGSICIYDGDFFLNNPHHLNNIPHYMIHNQPFFKTMNFAYDGKKKYDAISLYEDIKNESKGFIDSLLVKQINEKNDYDINRTVYADASEIIKPNRFSNPRAEERANTTALAENIVDTIKSVVESNQEYYSTKYTQQKQINLLGELFVVKLKNNEHLIYGLGLSLANGQHSSMAYYIANELMFGEEGTENSKYEEKIYSKLKEKISDLMTTIKRNKKPKTLLKQIKKGMTLQAKITTAQTKEEEIQIAKTSNATVGGNVDTEITRFTPLLIQINAQLVEDGHKIQFIYPRCPQLDGYEYISYETLVTLFNLKRYSNTMSKFRSNGTKKDFDVFADWLFSLKNEKKQVAKLKEELNNLDKEEEDKQKDLEDAKKLLVHNPDEPLLLKTQRTSELKLKNIKSQQYTLKQDIERSENYEYNLDSKNIDENYNNILIFNEFFETVNPKSRLLASKLASGLWFQHIKANKIKGVPHNAETIKKNAVSIADFLSDNRLIDAMRDEYNVDIGVKNGLFDATKISTPLQELIIKRIGCDDFELKEIAELIISLRKVEEEEAMNDSFQKAG
tara:strand:- start:22185 stop:24365 length:2181 start_codon:yes stop_codon:yes gene_type:complete